jgi:enediyne biosynthesis protein E4
VLIVDMDDRPVLLRNEGGGRAGHWLQVRTIGTKGNRDGLGALVKVVTPGGTQYDRMRCGGNFLSGNDLRLHFGLGTHLRADLVEVRWPSGLVDILRDVKADQVVVIEEGHGQIATLVHHGMSETGYASETVRRD